MKNIVRLEQIKNELKNRIGDKHGKISKKSLNSLEMDIKIYKDALLQEKNTKKDIKNLTELLLLHLIARYEKLKEDSCFTIVNTSIVNSKKVKNSNKIRLSVHVIDSSSNVATKNSTKLISLILRYFFVRVKYYKKSNELTFDYLYDSYYRDLIFEYIESIIYILFMGRTVYLEK